MGKFNKIYYGVVCSDCGQVELTQGEYDKQMNHPDSLWYCPICHGPAYFDDERHEKSMENRKYKKPSRKNKIDRLDRDETDYSEFA